MNNRKGPSGKLVSVAIVSLLVGYLIGREHLKATIRELGKVTKEELQYTVTNCIVQEIRLYVRSMDLETRSLVRLLRITGAVENVADDRHEDLLRQSAEEFVREAENILFLTIINQEQRGIAGGDPTVGQDDLVKGQLGKGFQSAQLGTAYHSPAFLASQTRGTGPVMVMARPLDIRYDFRGMVATVVSLEFLRNRLEEASERGRVTYVVDKEGHLVVHPDLKKFTVGQDMSHVGIVQMFLANPRKPVGQMRFELEEKGKTVELLGTWSAVPELDWIVIVQEPVDGVD